MGEEKASSIPLDYRGPSQDDPGANRKRVLLWIAVGFVTLFLLSAILLPTTGRARETANRVKCASNLRQIGQAVMLYANDHRGQLPPDLVTLYWHSFDTTDGYVLICPSGSLEKAPGYTRDEITAMMLGGDHLAYAWVGTGNLKDLKPDDVIAFDIERHLPKDSAPGMGINVLFADSSAQFVDEKTAKAIWSQFVAGVRPIRLPVSAEDRATSPSREP